MLYISTDYFKDLTYIPNLPASSFVDKGGLITMELDKSILSELTINQKYARFYPETNRRETWEEIVERNKKMHIEHYNKIYSSSDYFRQLIDSTYDLILNKKILPSMRSIQFGGDAIKVANNRVYNCAFMPIDSLDSFSEAMFLLLGGTGVGYSVQKKYLLELPTKHKRQIKQNGHIVDGTNKPGYSAPYKHIVGDSIEGWADAVKVAVEISLRGLPIDFDYSKIRPKGTLLKTSGGRAPGYEPLKNCLDNITKLINSVEFGKKLTPLQAHDIMCYLADAVLAGGIRRAAMISLFDKDDKEMLLCKTGTFYADNPQRMRANNSVVLDRKTTTREDFNEIWSIVKENNTGEPGFYFTNNVDWGTNPCCEIALQPFQFCNLTEINVSDIESELDLHNRVVCASFLGTLQAGYTDFHYLRPIWKETTEREALIGVSMTGIASDKISKYDLQSCAALVKTTNTRIAELIGINKAARTTCIKPAGTTSLTLGTSSGIHAWHNDYYIRRIRIKKSEPIYPYLQKYHPLLIEDDKFDKEGAVISVPQCAPKGSILRNESPIQLLERVKKFNKEWIREGHNSGDNTHNVSATISIRNNEWDSVGEWMWDNRDSYNGIAVLPYDGGTYIQAPFEDCNKEVYRKMLETLSQLDLTKVVETEDLTNLEGEIACAGGMCEIDFIYNESENLINNPLSE